jgi:hypothetical protein
MKSAKNWLGTSMQGFPSEERENSVVRNQVSKLSGPIVSRIVSRHWPHKEVTDMGEDREFINMLSTPNQLHRMVLLDTVTKNLYTLEMLKGK